LEAELREAAGSGAVDEVMAILRLSHPDLPLVFSAVCLGCVPALQTVLEQGTNPDEKFDGLTPLSLCMMISGATPMQHTGLPRRPNLELDTTLEIVRALLSAGATPTAEDLWRACHSTNSALGELLLDSAYGAQLVQPGGQPPPLLRLAAMHCPDLVYPLLARGASQRAEFGPDGVLPDIINPAVFREARWKLLRVLYLLYGRGSLPFAKPLLGMVGAFLAEPVRLGANASAPCHHSIPPMPFSLAPLDMFPTPPPLSSEPASPPLRPLPLFSA
jgi:hypothetical protein